MTIKDLKSKLRSIDDSYTIALQKPDGTHMAVKRASLEGKRFTLWTDSDS